LVDLNDVWIYVYEKGEARYTDLIKAFVDTGKRSKTVLLNYKKQLEAAGKIKKKLSEVTNRPVYYVPDEMKDKVKLLVEKRGLNEKIDQMTPQKIQEFLKFLDFMVKAEEGEEFWLWLPDIVHPEKIKKFKYVETKILRQN
jgi:hypothetical protein